MIDYEKRDHAEWIDSWTQQVVLLITGIVITRQVGERLDSAASSVESLSRECNEKLVTMVKLLAENVDQRKRYVLGKRLPGKILLSPSIIIIIRY